MKKEHKSKKIKLNGKDVEIDEDIIELITVLNKFGIKTTHSCQGEKRGYVSINLNNVEIYHGIVNGKKEFIINLRFNTPK